MRFVSFGLYWPLLCCGEDKRDCTYLYLMAFTYALRLHLKMGLRELMFVTGCVGLLWFALSNFEVLIFPTILPGVGYYPMTLERVLHGAFSYYAGFCALLFHTGPLS